MSAHSPNPNKRGAPDPAPAQDSGPVVKKQCTESAVLVAQLKRIDAEFAEWSNKSSSHPSTEKDALVACTHLQLVCRDVRERTAQLKSRAETRALATSMEQQYDLPRLVAEAIPLSMHRLLAISMPEQQSGGVAQLVKGILSTREAVEVLAKAVKKRSPKLEDTWKQTELAPDAVGIPDAAGKTPLMYACDRGHLAVLHYWHSKGALRPATVHARDPDGKTAFWYACAKGLYAVVTFLGDTFGPDIAKDTDALACAAARGRLDVAYALVERLRLDVNRPVRGGDTTPFWHACRHGHLGVAKYLRHRGATATSAALLAACECTNKKAIQVMQFLTVDCKLDTRCPGEEGCTVLCRAIEKNNAPLVEFLACNHDAPACRKGPIGHAAEQTNAHMLFTLLACDAHPPEVLKAALRLACAKGLTANAKELLKTLGKKPDWGLLALAATHDHMDTVEWLCTLDWVDVNRLDDQGWTALDHAAAAGCADTVSGMARRLGAKSGGAAVRLAILNKHWDVARALFHLGHGPASSELRELLALCDDDATNKLLTDTLASRMAEFLARIEEAQYDAAIRMIADDHVVADVDLVVTLAAKGDPFALGMVLGAVDVNAVDRRGQTALVAAALTPNPKNVEHLIQEAGADVNRSNASGQFALEVAVEHDAQSVICKLVACPALDLNTMPADKVLAMLATAAERGTEQVVDLVLATFEDLDTSQALVRAAAKGQTELLDRLYTADTATTAVRAALSSRQLGAARTLLARGGVTFDRAKALREAVSTGRAGVVQFLVQECQCVVDAQTLEGAAREGHLECTTWLVNHTDRKTSCQPAFNAACEQGHKHIAQLFTSVCEITGDQFKEALASAVARGQLEVARWIVAEGRGVELEMDAAYVQELVRLASVNCDVSLLQFVAPLFELVTKSLIK